MALSMKSLFFTISSATGVGVTQDCTGFGFQPVAYLVFWNGRTEGVDTVGLLDCHLGVGAATSASVRAAADVFYDQGTTTCLGGSGKTPNGVVTTYDAGGGQTGRADHDSFLSDGIRLIIDDQFPVSLRILIVAFGGSDITNVDVREFVTGTGTGTLNCTGLGFNPGTNSCVFFFGMPEILTTGETGNEDQLQLMFGAARTASAIQQYVTVLNSDDDSATMDVDSYSKSGECLATIAPAGAASCNMRAAMVGPITDGFQLNVTENSTATAKPFFAVTIKGGSWHLGDLLTQTDTTTDIVESGFGFQPRGAMFLSHCLAQSTADTPQLFGHFSVGACTSTSDEIALGFIDEDATGNMETAAAIEHDAVYANISTAAAIEGLMVAITFPQSDGFTMEMSDADPAQSFVWYVAAGDTPAAPKSLVHDPRTFQHMLVR